MKRLSTFEKIRALGHGSHHCGRSFLFSKGWIDVNFYPDCVDISIERITVYWMEGRNFSSHGTAKAVTFDNKTGNILYVFKQAISMWMVKDKNNKRNIIKYMNRKIDEAYKLRFNLK